MNLKQNILILVICCLGAPAAQDNARTAAGTPEEPVRFIGNEVANPWRHDGGLRPVVGVKNYQVLRANRSHPEWSDGFGWTYTHEPMIAYWNGRFYVHWFQNPVNEHTPPCHTMLTSSTDGMNWEMPHVLFPVYEMADGRFALMHQRQGFYVAPNGRLLALGFYGPAVRLSTGGGIGRVVREIYKDNTLGPIHFIRYNTHDGFNQSNTWYSYYKSSPDAGFREACDAMLADKLHTLGWWEEDRSKDGFYAIEGGIALSFFHRRDGKVAALWKQAQTALSSDEGKSWSPIVTAPSIVTATGKNWGQRTDDGRYAMIYNPSRDGWRRWPLAIVTGEDGILFDNMLTVHGEVPPRRFGGRRKDLGPQYIRGIAEGNGNPPGNDMWVVYSVNKEDIWVSRIPVPVRGAVRGTVRDSFENEASLDAWNLYCPRWAPAGFDSREGALELRDKDPYDYSKAVRVFPESPKPRLKFRLRAGQNDHGRIDCEVVDAVGRRAVRLIFDSDGMIRTMDGPSRLVTLARYEPRKWMDVALSADAAANRFTLSVDEKPLLRQAELAEPVAFLERLVFRTGEFRTEPTPETMPYTLREKHPNPTTDVPLFWWGEDLRAPDIPVKEAQFHIDDVRISP